MPAKETAFAEETTEKIYCDATLEDEFSSDRVLVVLKESVSSEAKSYSANNFSEISCQSIKDLTETATQTMRREKSRTNDSEDRSLVNTEHFKQILSIELKEKSKENVLDAISELEQRDDVLYAGPDYSLSIVPIIVPNPNETEFSPEWARIKINLPAAWDKTTGSSSVVVGVMDTGIQGNHPDLINQIDTSLCMDFTGGQNLAVGSPIDPNGHGTLVAGVIGAQGNNSVGMAGVCKNVKLASLRVLDENGNGEITDIINAINFASLHNISVLNASLGGYFESHALKIAIENYKGLLVCAAGNGLKNDGDHGVDTDVYFHSPSSIDADNIISVGASNRLDEKFRTSNYGKTTVDLFAPGEGIYTTTKNGTYDYESHTSMATPHVAGVAALIYSLRPHASVSFVKDAILNSVDVVYDLVHKSMFGDLCVTDGRLNAYNAVTYMHNTHTYDNDYSYINNKHHFGYCSCGASQKMLHTTDSSNVIEIKGKKYANCLGCKHSIELSGTFIPIIKTSLKGSDFIGSGITLISSRMELNQYVNNQLSQIYTLEEITYSHLTEYDDKFFEKYALIFGTTNLFEKEKLTA